MGGGIAHFLAMAGTIATVFGLLAARDYWFGDRAARELEDDDFMIDNPSPPPPSALPESASPGETPTQRYRHRRIVERESGGWALLYPGDPGYDDAPPNGDESQ